MTTQTQATPFRLDRAELLTAFARGIRPRRQQPIVEWVEQHFFVPTGPYRGSKMDFSLTPYVREILECLAPSSPWTDVAVKKSAQTGLTTIGIAWLMHMIDVQPDPMMIIQPTITAARDFNIERLDPARRLSPRIRGLVAGQKSRDGDGSTTFTKAFPGGLLFLTGANSATDLSSKTVRYALRDEVDRWPLDVDGNGDPMSLVDGRQVSYTRFGQQKNLIISTPALKQSSRIDKAYELGDQRQWLVKCPFCAEEISFEFRQMRGDRQQPYSAHYIAQCCGGRIDAWRQRDMVIGGRWVAKLPGQGRQPSFFINALSSLLTSWDTIWKTFLESEGDPLKEKGFTNLALGESYEEHGSDLDPARIVAAAEDYPRDGVPPRVARTVFAVDTQGDRFEWALWGFGPSDAGAGLDQWLIAAGVIDGDLHTQAPWDELERAAASQWPYSGGRSYPADIAVIDTGGSLTQAVYKFCHRKPRWRALKGSSDRKAVALGTPTRIAVKNQFGRKLFNLPLYLVGVFDIKKWVSHALSALENGEILKGGLHLCRQVADHGYVEQLTAEVLIARERRDGFLVHEWKKIRERNEALDLAVYARAFAIGPHPNGLGLDRVTPQQWAELIAERHAEVDRPDDLFAPHRVAALPVLPEAPAAAKLSQTPPPAPSAPAKRRKLWEIGGARDRSDQD